jgi:hypothetical protein
MAIHSIPAIKTILPFAQCTILKTMLSSVSSIPKKKKITLFFILIILKTI